MNIIKIYEASKIMWDAIKNEELINSYQKKNSDIKKRSI